MNENTLHVLTRGILIKNDNLLLCKTRGLSNNFYFLPGGHVELGESVEQALIREIKEETGAQCQIKQFLGCLEYSFKPLALKMCHNHEYNFIFEIESKLSPHHPIASVENHIELIWIPLIDLLKIDFKPEPLKALVNGWITSKVFPSLTSDMI